MSTRQDVQGDGPGLVFGGKSYFPGITGTHDWQKIGFVCRPNEPLHTVGFTVLNSGSGTVWFDDFMIRTLKAGEKPVAPIAAEPKPIAPAAAGEKILAWDSGSYAKDDLRTLLDRAGHGGHGRIEGTVAVVDDDGHRVLEITGDSGYVMTDQTSLFTPPQSLAVWIKPGKLTNDWNMIATGGPWNRAWSLFLFYKQTPYNIDFRPWGRRVFTEGVVPQDKWSHLAVVDDSKTYTIYVNGEPVKTDKSSGSNWTPEGAGPLVLGTMLYYGKPKSGFCGRIGAVTMWNKALTAEEVKAETARGVQ